MRHLPRQVFSLFLLLPLMACAAAGPSVDLAAEEQAIRDRVAEWNRHLAQGDAAAVTALYTEDGYVAPPGAERVQGHAGLEEFWGGMLSLPGLEVEIVPAEIDVARAGDVAIEHGTYALSFDAEDSRVEDSGKYIVVWEKHGDTWMVAADIFNSNLSAD